MKPSSKPAMQRRSFLIGATAGGAAAVTAAVSGGRADEAVQGITQAASTQPKGYRETDHIRQYYDTTRI
jgi:secreted PhoX family phosphatase